MRGKGKDAEFFVIPHLLSLSYILSCRTSVVKGLW
jgi:hypothetical protein